MTDYLKPCPFCPCAVIYTHEPPWGGFATICTECGGEGPNKDSQERAEAAWNRRSNDVLPSTWSDENASVHAPHPDVAPTSQPSTCADPVEACRLFCAWKGGGPCLAEDCPRRDCAQPERQGEPKEADYEAARRQLLGQSPPPTDDIDWQPQRCRCGGVIRQQLMGMSICGSCGRTP